VRVYARVYAHMPQPGHGEVKAARGADATRRSIASNCRSWSEGCNSGRRRNVPSGVAISLDMVAGEVRLLRVDGLWIWESEDLRRSGGAE
jgi:hypothetical protein